MLFVLLVISQLVLQTGGMSVLYWTQVGSEGMPRQLIKSGNTFFPVLNFSPNIIIWERESICFAACKALVTGIKISENITGVFFISFLNPANCYWLEDSSGKLSFFSPISDQLPSSHLSDGHLSALSDSSFICIKPLEVKRKKGDIM